MLSYLKHRFLHPLKEFLHDSKAIGVVLLSCTIISLILANLPISSTYINFWNFSFDATQSHAISIAFLHLPNSPMLIINDALMALFFLIAGMEIKRELMMGELASFKQASLPIMAAIGGMIFPALIFAMINKATNHQQGWAIPMATDIAFTLGIASLLGKRVPMALKIFLTALAIIDDLGAIVVIALFYGTAIKLYFIIGILLCVIALLLLNKFKVTFGLINILLGILLWYCTFNSGIHASVAGVIFAFCVPTTLLAKFELKLHTPVYFFILPLFALANTAITFPSNGLSLLNTKLSMGIVAGLCIGKPLGITLTTYLMIKTKLSTLPIAVNLNMIVGAGMLAGIGFTMSIFIATLAFSDINTQNVAKISVLIASFLAMIFGSLWLYFFNRKKINLN